MSTALARRTEDLPGGKLKGRRVLAYPWTDDARGNRSAVDGGWSGRPQFSLLRPGDLVIVTSQWTGGERGLNVHACFEVDRVLSAAVAFEAGAPAGKRWAKAVEPVAFSNTGSLSIEELEGIERYSIRDGVTVGRLPIVQLRASPGAVTNALQNALLLPPDSAERFLAALPSNARPPFLRSRSGRESEEDTSPGGEQGRDCGWEPDPATRMAVEKRAIAVARQHLRRQGWDVESVEADNCGYDLKCSNAAGRQLQVEVKGTRSPGHAVTVTANELAYGLAHPDTARLLVVSGIQHGPGGIHGGSVMMRRWRPGKMRLPAGVSGISFRYQTDV